MANKKKNPVDDFGFVPEVAEAQPQADEFGFVPEEQQAPTPQPPPNYQPRAGQPYETADFQKKVDADIAAENKVLGPELVKDVEDQFKQSVTGLSRFATQGAAGLMYGLSSPEQQAVAEANIGSLQQQAPLLFGTEREAPKTTAGTVAGVVGGLVDPVGIMLGTVIGQGVKSFAVSRGFLMPQAERIALQDAAYLARATGNPQRVQTIANALKGEAWKNALVSGPVEGVVQGAAQGTIEASERGQEGLDATATIARSILLGAGIQSGLSAVGAARQGSKLNKLAKNAPKGFNVKSTPTTEALADEATALLEQEAQLRFQAEGRKQLQTRESIQASQRLPENYRKEAETVDLAAQRAAQVEFGHEQAQARIDARVDRERSKLARLEQRKLDLESDNSDILKVGEKQSRLEAEKLRLQQEIDDDLLRSSGRESLESAQSDRIIAREKLKAKADDLKKKIQANENARISDLDEKDQLVRFKEREKLQSQLKQVNDEIATTFKGFEDGASIQDLEGLERRQALRDQIDIIDNHIADLRSQIGNEDKILKARDLDYEIKKQRSALEVGEFNERVGATQKRDAALEELSSNLELKQSNLRIQRQQLLKRIQSGFMTADQVEDLRLKLSENLKRQAEIQVAQKNLGYRGLKNNQVNAAVRDGIEIAMQQHDKAVQLGKSGLLDMEKAKALAALEFDNSLRLQGISRDSLKATEPGFFRRGVENWSKVGVANGVRTGEVVQDSIAALNQVPNEVEPIVSSLMEKSKALRDMGWTNEQITLALQYIERGGFNPAAKSGRSLTRPQWQLEKPPTQQELEVLQSIRQDLDNLHVEAVNSGLLEEGQLVDGYVPLRQKPTGRKQGKGIGDPAFTQARTEGALDPSVHELDFDQLAGRYVREVKAAKHLNPVIENGVREIVKLRLLGNNQAADEFGQFLKRVYGLSTEVPLEQAFGQGVASKAIAAARQSADAMRLPDTFWQEVYSEISNTAYKNWTAANPKQILFQWLQPEVFIPAETGVKAYSKARVRALTSSGRQEVDHLMKFVQKESLPALEELGARGRTSKVAKVLGGVGDAIDKLQLTKPFKVGEKLNRYTALLAGKEAFKDALSKGGLTEVDQKLLPRLLPAERDYVSRFLKLGDIESASDAYALVIDRRSNFSYSMADRPEVLQGKIGKYVPFTTYFHNVIERGLGDIENGNFKQLAKRVAVPMAVAGFLSSLTGKDFSEMEAQSAYKRAFSEYGVAPAVVGSGKKILQSKNKAEAVGEIALDTLTPLGSIYRAGKNIDKTGNPFGLKPAKKSSWLKELLK